ncbi:hypothetical protein F2P81_004608 [Scophthalmus maximus]|uniref:C2H2-type domain-containing protein n=1 Tax=Scophthalmus maximus TaxID=52904 RepID=A0A6A4TK59_SCOMX|nr:hypothetical protein F2P81_004608 [Scophthalmus maximus]
MDRQHGHTPDSAAGQAAVGGTGVTDSPRGRGESLSQSREIIKPTITELTKEVRTNILCTVKGCGKILPNTPALNMHLVKSHRIKVNVFVRSEGVCAAAVLTRLSPARRLENASHPSSQLHAVVTRCKHDVRVGGRQKLI